MKIARLVANAVLVIIAIQTSAGAQTLLPQKSTPTAQSAKPKATATAVKPKVPVGVDPGGVAVAFIGPGLDYTQPDIAESLARDGEGELIGFDLVANDRKPFAKQEPPADHETMMSFAAALLSQDIDIKLQVFKTTNRDTKMIARAIQMAAQANARMIVLWAPPVVGTPPNVSRDDGFISAAKTRFPTIAFLAAPITLSHPKALAASSDTPAWEHGDFLPHDTANTLVKSMRAVDLILRSNPNAKTAELAAVLNLNHDQR